MRTKLGVHVTGGSRNGYGDVAAAAPAVVCAVNTGGALTEAAEKSGGRTITTYRDEAVYDDAPPGIDHMTEEEARAAADHHWPALLERWNLNPADYYRPTNELGGDNPVTLANLVAFETRLMELAEAEGIRLCVGNPAGGSPGSWDLWLELYVPLIRRAAEGGHIYGRNAYGGVEPNSPGTLTVPGPEPADANALRPFREAAYLREQGLLTPIVIIEAGQNGGYQFPGVDVFIEDVARYDQLCQEHDNIWGFGAWTYGSFENANIQAASDRLAAYLEEQGGAERPSYPDPAIVDPEPPADETDEQRWWRMSVDEQIEHGIQLAPTALQDAIHADNMHPVHKEAYWPGEPPMMAAEDWANRGSPSQRPRRLYVYENGQARWFEDPEAEDPASLTIEDITDDLPHHPTKQYATRNLTAIQYITIHHSVTPAATTPATIARYHVDSLDWPGIAYHYLVYSDGRILQVNRLETVSYHDAENTPSVGVCLVGDFQEAGPTTDQLEATRRLLDHLRGRLPGVTVRPHRHVSQTACPGDTWQSWWDEATGTVPAGTPEEPPDMYLAVDPLSQRDSRWAGIILGQNTGHGVTIGGWGCLMVAYNVMARFLGLTDALPPEFQQHLVATGGMAAQYTRAHALASAYPDQIESRGWKVRADGAMHTDIRERLAAGMPVPARVDFVPATSPHEQHWVLLIGTLPGDDYYIADPWTGQLGPLSEFYPIAGSDVLEALFYAWREPDPEPPPPATGEGNARIGLHASADSGDLTGAELALFALTRPQVNKVLSSHAAGVDVLSRDHPDVPFIVRAFLDFGGRDVSPADFVSWTLSDVQRAINNINTRPGHDILVEIHNEPNLSMEGWTSSWSTPEEFSAWLLDVLDRYRQALPDSIRFIYPGLSPGGSIASIRHDWLDWLERSRPAVNACDALGVHAYWAHDYPMAQALGVIDEAIRRFPGKPIWVTEASNNKAGDPAQKGHQYVDFWLELRRRPAVQGVTYFVASASNPDFADEVWLGRGIAEVVGNR